MSSELVSCVHACTDAATEYNSGNTMELGQSCFDARLRNSSPASLILRHTPTHANFYFWIRSGLEMRQITCWTCLLLVVLSLVAVRNVAACSCRADHPQTKFCLADYVATVRVKSERHEREQINYKVKVNKMFKSNAEAEVILKEKGLWTPSSDSMCGVRLNVGETYVISGHITSGEARLSICDISIRWSTVNRRHRKDFKWFYHHGCVCKIRYTPWWHKGIVLETEGGKQCLWESTPGPQSCQEQYGVCMAGPSGCSWYPSTPYKNCIKEYQRRRELQRSLEP